VLIVLYLLSIYYFQHCVFAEHATMYKQNENTISHYQLIFQQSMTGHRTGGLRTHLQTIHYK